MMATTLPSRSRGTVLAWAVAACVLLPAVASAQDKTAERAARRAQLQLQNLQQKVEDAQAAQAKADADKADAEKKLAAQAQEIPRVQASARQAAAALKASEAARAELQGRLDDLQKQLAEQKRSGDADLAAKTAAFKAALDTRDAQQRQLLARLDTEAAQFRACGDKNQKLVELGAELLERYRNKGFAEIASQKDPVLGLGQVEMFNLVQDYRDRMAAQRLTPTPSVQTPKP